MSFRVGNNSAVLPADTVLENTSHWLVYSASSLVEQTTPSALQISEQNATVGSMSFVGTDLNMDTVNGSLVWAAPAELFCLEHFVVYIASDPSGSGRSKLGEAPVGQNYLEILEGEAYGVPCSFSFRLYRCYIYNMYTCIYT